MKLRNLFYLLLALPLVFAACENGSEEADKTTEYKSELTLTSESIMEVSAEAGNYEILYTAKMVEVTRVTEPAKVTVECTSEWVTIGEVTDEKCAFAVEANEGEAREATITVKYDTESFDVTVKQAANEVPATVEFEAVILSGYYASGAADGLNVDNYYFMISDTEFDEEGDLAANAKAYSVDLYVEAYEGEWCETMAIPVGEYTLDLTNSSLAGTFSQNFSYYCEADEDAVFTPAFFEAGKLVVTETGLTLTVTIDGVEHVATYTGECRVENDEEAPVAGNEIHVDYAYATYYGDQYTPGTADNFYFFLSEDGLDADGWEVANGKYYRFDLYTELVDTTNGVAIPYGTYTWDATDSYAPGTISAYYSEYYVLDEYGWDYVEVRKPTDATITVDANGVVAEVWFGEELIKIIFEGVVAVTDTTSDDGGDGEIYSTLTSDVNFNIEGATFIIEDYGDYYYNGTHNYVVYVYEDLANETGAYLMFDLLTAGGATNIAGEYLCADSEEANTFFGGYYDTYWEEFYGSWYVDMSTGDMAPVVEGTLDFDIAADGAYTLTFVNCYDDADNAIAGTIKGRLYGDEGGNDNGGDDSGATSWPVTEFVWSWISDGCGDIIFKTTPDADDNYNAFKLSFNGIPSNNVLQDGSYSSEDGSMNASWSYHLLWDNANGCAMKSVAAEVSTDASGITTIVATWVPNNGTEQLHTFTWVGEMPIYGEDW